VAKERKWKLHVLSLVLATILLQEEHITLVPTAIVVAISVKVVERGWLHNGGGAALGTQFRKQIPQRVRFKSLRLRLPTSRLG